MSYSRQAAIECQIRAEEKFKQAQFALASGMPIMAQGLQQAAASSYAMAREWMSPESWGVK